MFNRSKDRLSEYEVMNPFNESTKKFQMADSNIMPNIIIMPEDYIYEDIDRFLQEFGKEFFENDIKKILNDEEEIVINYKELYKYVVP